MTWLEIAVTFLVISELLGIVSGAIIWRYRHTLMAAIRREIHAEIRVELCRESEALLDITIDEARLLTSYHPTGWHNR